ncbi:MAG: class I SAM-dependent methyltransferase [Bacteroidetes bacterium]|nr:class I SAM-dependent methyltransferase [Bacteroidota bacterium]
MVFKESHEGASLIATYYEKEDPKDSVAAAKEIFFNAAIDFIDRHKGRQPFVLDIGCGNGTFLKKVKNKGWKPFGVEISTILAQEANAGLGEHSVIAGNIHEARHSANTFEVITLWDVLGLSENPFQDLTECHRILSNGGIIGIRVPNIIFQKTIRTMYNQLFGLTRTLGVKNPSVLHNFCFSPRAIALLLQRAGFKKVKVINSPLSSGDPYRYSKLAFLTMVSKKLIQALANLAFWISRGRLIIGPSLLIWAQKKM